MTCEETAALLTLAPLAFSDVQPDEDEPALTTDEATRLEEHLTGCEACREVAAALANAYRGLDDQREERTTMEPMTTDLRERTLAAVRDTLAHDAEPAQKKDAPAAVEPGPDPARLEAIGKKIALACTYCHDHATRDEVLFCASCLAPHHRECFETHGRCTLPGCGETRTVRPADAPQAPARRSRRWLAFPLLAGALGAGGIAALALAPPARPVLTLDAESRPLPITAPEEDEDPPPPPPTASERAALDAAEAAAAELGGTPRLQVALSADAVRAVDFVDLDVTDVDLAEVMARLGAQVGRNVLVDPSVRESVSVSLRSIPWQEAVLVIARMARCEVEERPGGVLFLTQPARVTIQFTDANVRTILQLLAAYSGKNLILGPDVAGTLSVDFKETNWWEALQIVAENRKLHLVRCRGDAVIITSAPLDPAILAGLPLDAPIAGDPGPLVWIEAEAVALADVIDQLGRVVERNILVDPSVDEPLTVSLRGVPLRDALDVLARAARCQLEERPGGIFLFTQPPRGTLEAADCPATPWFQLLAAAGGFGTILDGSGLDPVTVNLSSVEYEVAARLTAAPLGLAVKSTGGMLSFIDVGAPAGGRVVQAPTQQDERLGALIADVARLARAASAATDAAKRAALADELEARQTELRALLAPAEPLSLADLITRANGARMMIEQAVTAQDQPAMDAAMGDLLELLAEGGNRMPDDLASVRRTSEAARASELRVRGEQVDQGLAALEAALKAERWSEARAARERLDAIVISLRARSDEAPVAALIERIERAAAPAREQERARDLVAARGRVQAILRSDGLEAAVINGAVYRVGETLRDDEGELPAADSRITVSKIDDGAVTLELGGATFTRALGSD
jgi:hypothetical protein